MPKQVSNKTIIITAPLLDENLSITFQGKILPNEHSGNLHIVLNTQAQFDLLFDQLLNARLGKPAIPFVEPPTIIENPNVTHARINALAHMNYISRVEFGIHGDSLSDWLRAEAFLKMLDNSNNPKLLQPKPKEKHAPSLQTVPV